MPKEYKRIGWVMQRKYHRWYECYWTFSYWKRSESINKFDSSPGQNLKYQYYRRKGLARCVPVYVEVKDA